MSWFSALKNLLVYGSTYVADNKHEAFKREGDGVGARVLRKFRIDLENTRKQLLRKFGPSEPPETKQL